MNKRKLIDASGIPRNFDGCIHVVELQDGTVKVGTSASPRNRISSLDGYTRRKYATGIARFHISHNLPLRHAQHCEKLLIQKMQSVGKPIDGTIEYFRGVDFGAAVDMAVTIASADRDQPNANARNATQSIPAGTIVMHNGGPYRLMHATLVDEV